MVAGSVVFFFLRCPLDAKGMINKTMSKSRMVFIFYDFNILC